MGCYVNPNNDSRRGVKEGVRPSMRIKEVIPDIPNSVLVVFDNGCSVRVAIDPTIPDTQRSVCISTLEDPQAPHEDKFHSMIYLGGDLDPFSTEMINIRHAVDRALDGAGEMSTTEMNLFLDIENIVKKEIKAPRCPHPQYQDGHCAFMICSNYTGKCPRHAPSGSQDAICSLGT